MFNNTTFTAAVVAGALLAPAAAQADVAERVAGVTAHATAADRALDRAVALYEDGSRKRADRSFALSRRELGAAARDAAKLRRQADTPREQAAAAQATQLVAAQQDENVEQLVGVLGEVDRRAQSRISAAAVADVRGREKAIGVLTALLDEVPAQARDALTAAIGALATGRDEELEVQAEALADEDVSAASKRKVARSVEDGVDGQAAAAERLAGLIAGDDVPEEAKAGLLKAYDAVTGEHGSLADVLSRFSDRMPQRIRTFVETIAAQASEDAQGMRDDRPAPAAGRPEGTPTGQPQGTPTGQPQGTPTGQPQGTPTGQPDSTPTGQPQGTPTGQPQGTPTA